MTSKWVKQLYKDVDNSDLWDLYIQETIERIDDLLRRAMNLTDDPYLYEDIRKEIFNETKKD